MLEKVKSGYSVPTVIFILTFITFCLSLTIVAVTFYLNRANVYIDNFSQFKSFYEVLEKEIMPKMGIKIKDEDFTSPFDGWFSELPETFEEFTIDYFPEDSKLDINHIDASLFFEIKEDKKADKDAIIIKKIDNYLYYPDDLEEYLNPESDIDAQELFSIYNVPNINTADVGKIKIYLESWNIPNGTIEKIEEKINSVRGVLKSNYLKYKGTTQKKSGLIIDSETYKNLNYSLSWPEEDMGYKLLDFTGRINLNFVNEKVFEIAIKACGPKKADYKKYWNIIKEKREGERTIKDIKDIFKNDKDKPGVDGTELIYYYEKIFSVDSNFFKVKIKKDGKLLTAWLRRYKDREKLDIFKITVGKSD